MLTAKQPPTHLLYMLLSFQHRILFVLRRDDRYTAVSGELSREDFVVVLSSAPLEDGQAVRFGD